jgi:predicted permease
VTGVRVLLHRIYGLFRRKGLEQDLEDEVRFHLQGETEEGLRRGLSPAEARAAALRSFGGVTQTKEIYRETRGLPAIDIALQDLRYTFRGLRQSPGFTAAAVLSLALGIGANTAIFSLLNAVVLRMLPVTDPQRLVQFIDTVPSDWNSYFGYPQLERFQARSQTMSGVFGRNWLGRVNVLLRGVSGLAQCEAMTGNAFSVLGVTPQYGRLFAAGDDRPDASVAVLSDRYWRTRFGADPSVIGAAVIINQLPFTVIGITPPDFAGISTGSDPDVWLPLHSLDRLKPAPRRWVEPFTRWLVIVGRLRPGVASSQAQAEFDIVHRQLLEEQLSTVERPTGNMRRFVRESHLELRPAAGGIASGIRHEYELPLKLLMWVAGIVLLVACANVANLLLARASGRRREIAVRLSLGAARGRIVRQLLTESLVLASLGGLLALFLAWWGSLALVRMISTGDTPMPLDTHPDWRIFAFTTAVSLLTGLLFGLAPALRGTRIDPGPALKEGSRSTGHSSHALDRLLVVAQVALSVVLLTGAGLFVRTLHKLWSVDVGYNRENVLMFSVDASLAGYPPERAAAVYREILQRLQSLPDVRSAAASIVRPVDDAFSLTDRVNEIDGRVPPESEWINVAWNAVSPGYFFTLGTPILLGRDFTLRDDETAPAVVMVNETLAARAFPGRNPLGHQLAGATIVGVAKNSLYDGAHDRTKPVLYRPQFQHGKEQEYHWGFVSFEVRYRSSERLLEQVRREVVSVDHNLAIFRARTLQAQTEQSLLKERLLATLSSFFAGLGLLLACLGLYGLMAYAVARRSAEIGIRLALGAPRPHVAWLVLRETLCLAAAGIACGIPLALGLARYAKSLLFEIAPADPAAIADAIALLIGVAALAGYIPVRRALRVDPMSALRCE